MKLQNHTSNYYMMFVVKKKKLLYDVFSTWI